MVDDRYCIDDIIDMGWKIDIIVIIFG